MQKKMMSVIIALLTISLCANIALSVFVWTKEKARSTELALIQQSLSSIPEPTQAAHQNSAPESGVIPFAASEKYTLYIGTNDKTTQEKVMSLQEAKALLNVLCVKYLGDFTVAEVSRGWVDANGVLIMEDTLVYTLQSAQESQVISFMNEAMAELNQSSILVKKDNAPAYNYQGRN